MVKKYNDKDLYTMYKDNNLCVKRTRNTDAIILNYGNKKYEIRSMEMKDMNSEYEDRWSVTFKPDAKVYDVWTRMLFSDGRIGVEISDPDNHKSKFYTESKNSQYVVSSDGDIMYPVFLKNDDISNLILVGYVKNENEIIPNWGIH